jgi:hypothetical protein
MGYEKGKSKQYSMNEAPKEKLTDVAKYPIREIEDRGIRKETCERFGVRAALSTTDGSTPIAYYFPSYNQKGKIVGYMKQDITKDKSETGHWTAIGSVTIGNKLFGQNVAEAVERARKNIVVTEGQIDTLSAYQSCLDGVSGTKWDGLEPFVVSIPMGTANAVEALLHNQDYIKSFESLTTFFDNDECTPAESKKGIMKGKEATEAVMGTFVGTGLSLFTIETQDGFKDASDLLQADKSDELYKLVSFGKKMYTPEKIIGAADVSLEDIIAPAPEGLKLPAFPKLMRKTSGFHKRCLTTITAPSGAGKTTAVSLVVNAAKATGQKTGLIYLEEQAKETIQRLIAEDLKINYTMFKQEPLKYASLEAITESRQKIIDDEAVSILDHFGSLPVSSLMSHIKYMHEVEGCDYIVVDHISMLSADMVTDERKEIGVVMTELAAYAASHDVGLIVIVHLNRGGTADQFKVKKGEEDKPFWARVTKESLKGASEIEQLSFVIMALEPEILPNRERGRVRWVVLKNRPTSWMGEADIWKLNESTWEVETSELEDF